MAHIPGEIRRPSAPIDSLSQQMYTQPPLPLPSLRPSLPPSLPTVLVDSAPHPRSLCRQASSNMLPPSQTPRPPEKSEGRKTGGTTLEQGGGREGEGNVGKEGVTEGGTEGRRDGGTEEGRGRGREREKGRREGGRKGGMDGGREGRREGGTEGGRKEEVDMPWRPRGPCRNCLEGRPRRGREDAAPRT